MFYFTKQNIFIFFREFYNDGFSNYCRLGGYKKQQWIIEKKATENFCVPLPLSVPLLCQTTKLELQALVSERKCFKKASSSKTHTHTHIHSFPVVDLSGDSFSLKL